MQRERAPAVGVGSRGDRAHHPRALALVEGGEAAEVGGGEADLGAGVAEGPLERTVEAGEQMDARAGEQLGPDAEQGAVDAEVGPVVALAEGVEEARRLPGAERQPERVGGADERGCFGGGGHRLHPRSPSGTRRPAIAPDLPRGYPSNG